MKKVFKQHMEAGSRESHEPRLVGSIISDMLQSWHRNTALCVDVKTFLRNDRIMQTGKEYPGILRRDYVCDDIRCDERFTFVETIPLKASKRNPRLFEGRYLTITRRSDGSLNLNFKSLKMDDDFSVDGYAIGVCNELRLALKGLVEE